MSALMATDGPDGMPPSYGRNHGRHEQAAHRQILLRRAGALAHVEICPGATDSPDARWICVVTDDRPGLLSLLTAAISAHSLDIQNARIYCRSREGRCDEAIDLFAVRDSTGPGQALTTERLAGVQRTIESLLLGEVTVTSLQKRATPTSRPGRRHVSVRFDGTTDVLVVEAPDRPGLLLAISLAIFKERLTIVRSHVSTLSEHARDEFELAQIDGRRLTPSLRELVVQKVRGSLEGDGAAPAVSSVR